MKALYISKMFINFQVFLKYSKVKLKKILVDCPNYSKINKLNRKIYELVIYN